MNPAVIIAKVTASGIALHLTPDGTNLRIESDHPLTEEQRAFLRKHKAPLLAFLRDHPTPPPQPLSPADEDAITEAIQERAAIREFEAGEPRQEADQAAQAATRVYRFRLTDRPDLWRTLIAPGADLAGARLILAQQLGAERILDIRQAPRDF